MGPEDCGQDRGDKVKAVVVRAEIENSENALKNNIRGGENVECLENLLDDEAAEIAYINKEFHKKDFGFLCLFFGKHHHKGKRGGNNGKHQGKNRNRAVEVA